MSIFDEDIFSAYRERGGLVDCLGDLGEVPVLHVSKLIACLALSRAIECWHRRVVRWYDVWFLEQ